MEDRANIQTTVSGSSEGGYIVDMHDGEFHEVHISHADSEDVARDEGHAKFDKAKDLNGKCSPTQDDGDRGSERTSELADLRSTIDRLEANVADLLKNREAIKTERDAARDGAVEELRTQVAHLEDRVEHLSTALDEERERNKPDAHGRKPNEDRPETNATAEAKEAPKPMVETLRTDGKRAGEAPFNEAEKNAHDAGTLGVENRDNASASAKSATYADARADANNDRPLSDSEREYLEDLQTRPSLTAAERRSLTALQSRQGAE